MGHRPTEKVKFLHYWINKKYKKEIFLWHSLSIFSLYIFSLFRFSAFLFEIFLRTQFDDSESFLCTFFIIFFLGSGNEQKEKNVSILNRI